MEDAGKKAGRFGDIVKGVLTADAIKAGARAIVNFGKQIVSSYAEYEQLVGGVETLFGESAKTVQEYAQNAYKTAGMSANQYMETVTSFSASLLQSLGGDTKKAADYADKAVTDMADNANKMGTSMESIQNAYQGFAKQNYTMLDNLKLGYGGTKQEMERLIEDAEDLDDTFKASRDSNGDLTMSYADIVDAIHIVQDEMGITGTTAEEASDTISGSINSMKAAWENLSVGLADENANIEELMDNLAQSVEDVVRNLAPVVWLIIKTIFKTLIEIALEKLQELKEKLLEKWEGLKEDVRQKWEEIKETIREKIQEAKDEALEKVQELKDEALQKVEEFKEGIREKFENIKKKITDPIEEAKNKVSGFVADIKGFFENLKISLPHIALPHFSASYTTPSTAVGRAIWQKALGLEGKPVVSVDWYAKAMNNAMLLNSPTIFGMSGGNLLGAGEAGQEVVAGSDTLMGMIRNAVKTENGGGNIINIYPQNLTEAQIDYLFTRFNAKMGAMA